MRYILPRANPFKHPKTLFFFFFCSKLQILMRVGRFLNLAKLPLLALQKRTSITPNKQPATNQQPPNESHWKYFKLFLVSSWKKLGGNIPLLIKHQKWEFYLSKCFLLTNLEDAQETNIFSEDLGGNTERNMSICTDVLPWDRWISITDKDNS